MKTYNELTPKEQKRAEKYCLTRLLSGICEGVITFDNDDKLQDKILTAQEKADSMQTPWFAHEYIMDTCAAELEEISLGEATGSLYSVPGESVIAGIASNGVPYVPAPRIPKALRETLDLSPEESAKQALVSEACLALQALGYKNGETKKVVSGLVEIESFASVEELVKRALGKL